MYLLNLYYGKTESGKNWRARPYRVGLEVITWEQWELMTSIGTLKFFRRLGGIERYFAPNYLESTNPSRDHKQIRWMSSGFATLANAAGRAINRPVRTVFQQAVETLLWSEESEDSELSPEGSCELFNRVTAFVMSLSRADWRACDPAQHGHDLVLTANGHGAGYWDRGLGAVGDSLTTKARAIGAIELGELL